MPDIVLTTLNARYIHASFGLRYLRANLGDLRERSVILEFEASQRTVDILERILEQNPKIVGVGVYIWNAVQSLQLVSELKRIRPGLTIIVGGPEVSHETDQQEICRLADYVITGEADHAFATLCEQLLNRRRPLLRRIEADLPKFEEAGARTQGRAAREPGGTGGGASAQPGVRYLHSEGRSDMADARSDTSDAPSDRSDGRSEKSDAPSETSEARSNLSEARSDRSEARSERSAGRSNISEGPSDMSEGRSKMSEGRSDMSERASETSESPSNASTLAAPVSAPAVLTLPYEEYSDEDLRQRVVYVEASRGCPFSCEFCLSSLDVPVRNVPLEPFLGHMQRLFERGCRQFKFVDRTFNLNLNFASAILTFFLDRYEPGLFVHFEMVPDRLPDGLRSIIKRFPAGALQFEVGIQTFNPEVEKLISRRQNQAKLQDNLKWLRAETGVHVHADLIVGLPGEDVASFGRGFDLLVGLGPQEIQVGMLKRLRGTPIIRHDAEWEMVYSPSPPYEVLQTKLVSFGEMQRMRRFSRYWDLVANSGSFTTTLKLLLSDSPFARFSRFADFLWEKGGRVTHGIALHTLAEHLHAHLSEAIDPVIVADALMADFNRTERDAPSRILSIASVRPTLRSRRDRVAPSRQSRHMG